MRRSRARSCRPDRIRRESAEIEKRRGRKRAMSTEHAGVTGKTLRRPVRISRVFTGRSGRKRSHYTTRVYFEQTLHLVEGRFIGVPREKVSYSESQRSTDS